uniref:Uncharacterized protein n=1 Tax=Fagus sylvatica TaxID=28930 RepID=A0A2N9FSV2_FAGSY
MWVVPTCLMGSPVPLPTRTIVILVRLQMPNVSRIFKCQIKQDTALFSIYQNISG